MKEKIKEYHKFIVIIGFICICIFCICHTVTEVYHKMNTEKIDVTGTVLAKMEYNDGRHMRRHHFAISFKPEDPRYNNVVVTRDVDMATYSRVAPGTKTTLLMYEDVLIPKSVLKEATDLLSGIITIISVVIIPIIAFSYYIAWLFN